MPRLGPITLLVAIVAGGLAPSAPAADPASFATVSGTCPKNSQSTAYGTPLSGSHPSVVVRYTASGPALLNTVTIGADDVAWGTSTALDANDTPIVYAQCWNSQAAVPFTATFFDVPDVPTTYAGAGSAPVSTLPFHVAGETQFVADLQLTGGAVDLDVNGRTQRFASPGQFSIGSLYAGTSNLKVRALDGGRPAWSVRIRPLPVALSNLKFETPIVQPGPTFDATYTSSGDTSVTATIRNGAGALVRSLASGATISSGERSLTWDGRDDAARQLPDGVYRLTLESADRHGLTSSATADVTLDGTAPDLRVASAQTIAPAESLTVNVTDTLSGVAAADILDAETRYPVATLAQGQQVMSYRPSGGWSEGSHAFKLRAKDGAGNLRTVDYTVRVSKAAAAPVQPPAGGAAPLRCTKASAERAVSATGVFDAFASSFADVDDVFDVWVVAKVFCRDLTGDGRREMAAYLACCTVSSPTLLVIFRGTAQGWRVAFKSTRLAIWTPRLRGRSIAFKRPVYRRTDANCCPSRLLPYRIQYRGGRFRVRRAR